MSVCSEPVPQPSENRALLHSALETTLIKQSSTFGVCGRGTSGILRPGRSFMLCVHAVAGEPGVDCRLRGRENILTGGSSVGQLKTTLSHLQFENEQLKTKVVQLEQEHRTVEDRLVQEQIHNGDLAAMLDDARNLLRDRGFYPDTRMALEVEIHVPSARTRIVAGSGRFRPVEPPRNRASRRPPASGAMATLTTCPRRPSMRARPRERSRSVPLAPHPTANFSRRPRGFPLQRRPASMAARGHRS